MKKVSYIDSNLFSPKDAWDALSMAEKSEMMKVAVQNGITNLDDIRKEYNEFAEGGYFAKAKSLIKKNEGWMSKPYKDAPEGKSWRSVGYGFNDSGFYDKYPEGISRHYENGITKAQAEQELSYILNKADKHLRSIYGKQWDSFNDNQKAAIMDTYYQRPASVGKKSAFYNAVKSGKDASKYLGVKGFADRNKKRQSVFGGGAVPMVADSIDTSLPQEVALQPIVENIPEFIPLNPQAFNMTLPTYQRPELTFEEPVVQETPVSPYSPEEIERQERAEGLTNLGRFLSYTNPEGTGNSLLDTIGILTSTPAVSTAVRNNYVPATTTPYNRGNNMRRGFESTVAYNRMMDATSIPNNPLPEYPFPISYAEGGKIHIKPSHRGRLTELKKRTGKSEAELYKTGGPAVRKMITFARNARKWKHGLGGNLFDGATEDSQKMDNSYTYLKAFDNVYIDKEGNLIDPDVPSGRGTVRLPDLEVIANPIDVGRGKARRMLENAFIESNDATATPYTTNSHLNERGIEGAAKAAAWMQDNPTLNNVGMALGAVPLAVAGYPAFMTAGEGAATALANPYVDAALTSYFGAHGLQKLANGEADWSTALEIAPLGRVVKPIYEGVVQPGMRLFNSPLTGNWTKIGNKEYRLSPNSLGANGSSVEQRIPQITTENAASMTPEQWTAAQDAAIARGDMVEAQRLRDLHFKVNAPDNKLTTKLYHGTDREWNNYDPTHFSSGSGDLGAWGKGLYLSGYKNVAERYGKNIKSLYAYARNPLEVKPTLGTWYDTPTENAAYFFNREKGATKEIKNILKGKDAINKYREITGDHWITTHEPYEEVVIPRGEQIKSADAVTYDDNGVRIPLGKRDNFNINDIRYGLLPFGIGLTGYGLWRGNK